MIKWKTVRILSTEITQSEILYTYNNKIVLNILVALGE